MSNFAYVQPIFCPNEKLFEKNKKSIISFIEYYNKLGYNFQCVFGGYCSKLEYYSELTELITKGISNSTITQFDKNYGKAYVVNKLTEQLSPTVKYFLTADSDILFNIDQLNIKDRLIAAFEYSSQISQPAGVIGLFQEENNCHILPLCYQLKYYYNDNTEMICRPSSGGGMAGGCICVSMEAWQQIGGYKVLGVYASDDATLLKDCNSIGKAFFLSNSIRCTHPFETDNEYQDWKVRIVGANKNLDESIIEADMFWANN